MTSQKELPLALLNLINSKNIDWDGNCVFDDNGKIVEFKTQSTNNHYGLKPIPKSDAAMRDAIEADKLLESIMRPATHEQIAIAIKKLALHCGLQGKAPEEVQYMFIDYCQDLAEYPKSLIDGACAEYRKLPEGNNFLPSSGKLISLMQPKFSKMKFMRKRINQILGLSNEKMQGARENKSVSIMDAINNLNL